MYEKIKPYILKGLIAEQVHPENSDVRIYNYTPPCQYAGAWDEVTMKCRGLILNVKTGEQLSNPFPKFFNYEEHIAKGMPIPGETPMVFEKMDGWLGILYWLNGAPRIATRGSFTSTGALWATEWLQKNLDASSLNPDVTYLFEIISPITKIVLHYDFEGLVFIAARDIDGGHESFPTIYNKDHEPIKCAGDFSVWLKNETPERMRELNKDNRTHEGFVLLYPSGLRLKIKFDEYKRLHKIITGVSAIGIWESLRAGQNLSIDNVPDEFMKWFTNTKENIIADYNDIEYKAKNEFATTAGNMVRGESCPTRGDWAEQIKKMTYPGIGFAMMDNKDYSQTIWKMVRPHGQSVFKKDEL